MHTVLVPEKLEIRNKILRFEHLMRQFEDATYEKDYPLKHHFAPGVYGREIFLPKGSLVVGKIHKHAHLNMIMTGKVSVMTEDGPMTYTAPVVMVSKPGTKRVVLAHEDTIWVTVHLTESQDLKQIEQEIIAADYEEFDKLISDADRNLIEGVL